MEIAEEVRIIGPFCSSLEFPPVYFHSLNTVCSKLFVCMDDFRRCLFGAIPAII